MGRIALGAPDTGARSVLQIPGRLEPVFDISEATQVLALTLELAPILRAKGFNVVLTRTDARNVPWDDRRRIANAAAAASNPPVLFLSLHQDDGVIPSAPGSNTEHSGIYARPNAFPVNSTSQLAVVRQGGWSFVTSGQARPFELTRGWEIFNSVLSHVDQALSTSATPRTLRRHANNGHQTNANLWHFLRGPNGFNAEIDCLVFELGFIRHQPDNQIFTVPQFRTALLNGLAEGIANAMEIQ